MAIIHLTNSFTELHCNFLRPGLAARMLRGAGVGALQGARATGGYSSSGHWNERWVR